MHITDIFQLSTGTIVDLSEDISAVVGKYLTTDSIHFYRVKGTSTEFWNSLLVEKTENLSIGQEVYFCEKVQEDELNL